MIEFGTNKTKPQVCHMWQTVFGDSSDFTDIYFSQKYKNENTLIYFVDEQPVASLQMWEYEFSFYNKKTPIYYLAGLCTYEEHRRKGYMSQLIEKAHEVMRERNIALSILVPAEEWLLRFYGQYGYAQVFEKDSEPIPIQRIISRHNSLEKAFEMFERIYNKTDFTVLKNFDQFKTIVEEQKLTDFEEKTNLDALARVINAEALLKIYAMRNPVKKFTIRVTGDKQFPENNKYYTVEEGVVSKFAHAIADFEVDILKLCELLLGYDNEEFNNRLMTKFPRHRATINLMLE